MYLLPGKAPSLLIAKTTLVVTVMWEKPPKYTLIASNIDIANAPGSFPLKAIENTFITGCSVIPLRVSEILPFMAYNNPMKNARPLMIAAITPYTIPLGADT